MLTLHFTYMIYSQNIFCGCSHSLTSNDDMRAAHGSCSHIGAWTGQDRRGEINANFTRIGMVRWHPCGHLLECEDRCCNRMDLHCLLLVLIDGLIYRYVLLGSSSSTWRAGGRSNAFERTRRKRGSSGGVFLLTVNRQLFGFVLQLRRCWLLIWIAMICIGGYKRLRSLDVWICVW